VAVYYKSINCNPVTPLLRSVVDFVVPLVSTVDKILTDIACRAVSQWLAELSVNLQHLTFFNLTALRMWVK